MIANGQSRSGYSFTASAFGGVNGYDAAETTDRRRPPRSIVQAEDDALPKNSRKKVVSTARDGRRNNTSLRWAINKHLDFVVSHNFRGKSSDKGWNKELESFFTWASHKDRYDSRRKHCRRRFMRLFEACRTVDGDIFGLKLRGGRTQAIEGDRIRDPGFGRKRANGKREKKSRWVHGVSLDRFGAANRYCIHKRNGQNFTEERIVSARKVLPFGYYDRIDQERGVSLVASALREFGDVYDGFDYALAREKVNQFFTFLITRDSPEPLATDPDASATEREPYSIDFGKGPNVLDLDPGDNAHYLSAQGTSDQSQKFWDTVLAIAIKSLDIPFSFFREDFTNFNGAHAAKMLYLKSCKPKRADVVEYEDAWFRWRLIEGEAAGEITFPSGFDVETDRGSWMFIPDGVPWWNPLIETKANTEAVDNYQRSRSEIRRESFGDDWLDMMEEREREDDYLRGRGLPITVPKQSVFEVQNGSGSND